MVAYDEHRMNLETGPAAAPQSAAPIRALCIARHCFLSEHIARYFAQMGVVTTNAVGLDSAVEAVGDNSPDVVICDYDVLANVPLDRWEHNPLLARTPVIAVSLTRHAEELHLLDINGIAGFLYLPTLEQKPALQVLNAAASRPKYSLGFLASTPRPVERS
jgi:DNA-binding NarL/FixJ family response regulator